MRSAPAMAAAAAALLLMLSAGVAQARDPAAAEALFRAGRAAVGRGDWAEACAKFAESQRLDPAPGTLINLGECNDHLGRYASAWASYHEAADLLVGDDRLELVRRKMAAVEAHLSKLTIELVQTAPPASTVTRDGDPLGPASLGVALPVDPGKHLVVVRADGREPSETTITVGEHETRVVRVTAGAPLPVSAPPPPVVVPAPSPALRNAGIALAALGVVSVGAGAVTGVMTIQKKNTVQADCPGQACSPPGLLAASDGRTLSSVSTATFIAGTAALGAGVAMIVVGSRLAVVPSVGPGGAGLVWRGTF